MAHHVKFKRCKKWLSRREKCTRGRVASVVHLIAQEQHWEVRGTFTVEALCGSYTKSNTISSTRALRVAGTSPATPQVHRTKLHPTSPFKPSPNQAAEVKRGAKHKQEGEHSESRADKQIQVFWFALRVTWTDAYLSRRAQTHCRGEFLQFIYKGRTLPSSPTDSLFLSLQFNLPCAAGKTHYGQLQHFFLRSLFPSCSLFSSSNIKAFSCMIYSSSAMKERDRDAPRRMHQDGCTLDSPWLLRTESVRTGNIPQKG